MKIHWGVTKGCTVNIGENSSNVLKTIAMLQKLTSLGAVNIDARPLTRGQAETAVGPSAMAICRGNACARTRVRSTANEAKWLAEKRGIYYDTDHFLSVIFVMSCSPSFLIVSREISFPFSCQPWTLHATRNRVYCNWMCKEN